MGGGRPTVVTSLRVSSVPSRVSPLSQRPLRTARDCGQGQFSSDAGEASLHEVGEFADDAPDAHVLPNGNGRGGLAGHSSQGYLLPEPAARPRRRKADQERPVRLGVAAGDALKKGGFQSFLKRKGFRFSIASSRPMGRAANRPTEEIISKVRPFRLSEFKTLSFVPGFAPDRRRARYKL